MKRKPIIAGNWKMNGTLEESRVLINGILNILGKNPWDQSSEVVVAPPYTSLFMVNELLMQCPSAEVILAAQNCEYRAPGAYTGEISISMLKEFQKLQYIIIGHSERRMYYKEDDAFINAKAKAILGEGLIPIICCGESLEQRENNETDAHVTRQIQEAVKGIAINDASKLVFAYEPIWAIGTGKTCDSQEANRVIRLIRTTLVNLYSQEAANSIRILYGGSVKPDTIREQMSQSDIDGALVGGASLTADSFTKIVEGSVPLTV